MPQTRRRRSGLPLPRFIAEPKLNTPPRYHDILMLDPVLIPRLSVDAHVLDVRTQLEAVCDDRQGVFAVHGDVSGWEERRGEEVDGRCGERVETEQGPEGPGVEGARVGVT